MIGSTQVTERLEAAQKAVLKMGNQEVTPDAAPGIQQQLSQALQNDFRDLVQHSICPDILGVQGHGAYARLDPSEAPLEFTLQANMNFDSDKYGLRRLASSMANDLGGQNGPIGAAILYWVSIDRD